jgi:hypothetical protein
MFLSKFFLLIFTFSLLLSFSVDVEAKKSKAKKPKAPKTNEKMNNYYKRTGTKFLEEMAAKEGIYKLKSGMLVEVNLGPKLFF